MQVELCPENYKLGAVEIIPEDNFQTKLDKSIKRIAEKEGITKYKYNKRYISTGGGNYLGELYEVNVKGKTTEGNKELNIFVKKIINNEESCKLISVTEAYKTELFAYNKLSNIFEALQEEYNVPIDERYKMVKIYDGTDNSMVVMENIAKKGYKTYHRMDVASLKFLELCYKNIAKFHGLSFVLKEKQPEYFNKKLKSLKLPYTYGEESKKLFKNVSEITLRYVDRDLKEKVAGLYANIQEKLTKYVNDESIKKCLCHGDYRPNNIMMIEEEGAVQKVIPIDYQLVHYGCPIFDLLYLIYFGTDRKFRNEHMSNLKDLYYDTLKSFLKYFNIDSETVYPRSEFEKVYKEKLDYGLLISLQMLAFLFISEDDIPDITNLSDKVSFQLNGSFKERIQDIIEEFIELGYI